MHEKNRVEAHDTPHHQTLKYNQYQNASKFNARIQLYAKYATNKYPWPLWIFDQFEKKSNSQILELGCGTGLLWQVNQTRIPPDWNITLSDFSEGMLDEIQNKLNGIKANFSYKQINAESIPYPDACFDALIANNMLYHVSDLEGALTEIYRVLARKGILYASTIGKNHMAEMKQLISTFTQNDNYERVLETLENNFSLDNGLHSLQKYFNEVRVERYENSLQINETELLVDYILSCNGLKPGIEVLAPSRANEFRDYVAKQLQSQGQIQIGTDSGMFICRK